MPSTRVARSGLHGFREVTSRVHWPPFWRVLYWLLERRPVVHLLALLCTAAARRAGVGAGEAADRLSHLFLTGWPHHRGTPWVNLNVLRAHHRVRDALEPRSRKPQKRPRSSSARPQRIGVIGGLDHAFYFTRSFFEAAPEGTEIFAFDYGSTTDAARASIAPVVREYSRFQFAEVESLARAVEDAELDLLLTDVRKPSIHDLFDRISTPCIAVLCVEVFVRFHPSISFHLYCLQEADYVLRRNRLYCGTSRAWYSDQLLYPGWVPFEDHGLDPDERSTWDRRQPLVFFHGRLFKASDAYLDLVFGLLAEDSQLAFVAMGTGSADDLDRFLAKANAFGVADRFEYGGPFESRRDERGGLAGPAWERLFDLLGRARLAPDPWPFAGATTRLEAYLCGAPVAHMGLRTDPESWGRPQHMLTYEHPSLSLAANTAYTIPEYRELCRRVLYDQDFADGLASAQAERAKSVTDRRAFWTHLMRCYDAWLSGHGSELVADYVPTERRTR